MIEAIRNIGEYALEKENKSIEAPLDILIDDPRNKDTKSILFIMIKSKGSTFEYLGVDVDAYSSEKLKDYLYKKGSPNGTDVTPTAMITEIKKTFFNKIVKWFSGNDKTYSDIELTFLKNIGNCLRDNKERILDDLIKKQSKESNIISLKIDNKCLGYYPIFRNILVERAKIGFYFTKSFSGDNQFSKSEKKICSVCNQKSVDVYGFVNTFNFYTVDKPGFVSGGFRQKNAWKNYPVCLKCALTLEEGKKYIEKNLNFQFHGLKYILLPKFLSELDPPKRNMFFEKIEKQKKSENITKLKSKLTNDESEILGGLKDEGNYLNLNFMFYDAPKGFNGSKFNILLYIEDVLPSRLSLLFDIKNEIDNRDIFKTTSVPIFNKSKKKTGEIPLAFNFGILKTFFYDFSTNNWISKKYFLDIVNKIFTNKSISFDFLLKFIMIKIRSDFVNQYPTKISTLRGFMLLNYLERLELFKKKYLFSMDAAGVEKHLNKGILVEILRNMFKTKELPLSENATISTKDNKWEINNDGERYILKKEYGMLNIYKKDQGDIMDVSKSALFEENNNSTGEKINQFFNEFNDFFDSDAKKAVFLEGILTQFLLNIQRLPEVSNAKPGREPFRHKLKGLKLDENQIKILLPEIQNKLEEYQKNYYSVLESIISKYMISSGNNWTLSKNEISFYFVLGMNLSKQFKKEKNNNEKGD